MPPLFESLQYLNMLFIRMTIIKLMLSMVEHPLFGMLLVHAAETCSWLSFSLTSVSVLARLVYQVCLLVSFSSHACCLSYEEKGMRKHTRSWYFKVLTNDNAWIYYILYCYVFTSLFLLLQSLSSLWTSLVSSLRAMKHLMHVSEPNICPEFLFLINTVFILVMQLEVLPE